MNGRDSEGMIADARNTHLDQCYENGQRSSVPGGHLRSSRPRADQIRVTSFDVGYRIRVNAVRGTDKSSNQYVRDREMR
jgi:hypothetical protein